MTDISYTTADTALCIMMEHVEMEMSEEGSSPLADFVEFNGTGSLRAHILDYLAPLFDELWEKHAAQRDVAWPFDFEFVPRLLERLEFDQNGYTDSDAEAEAIKLITELNKEFG